jgi:hypothetical protein
MTTEAARADLRAQTGYTAQPPQTCLNGCHVGTGPARAAVACEPGKLLCSGKRSCTERLGSWLQSIVSNYALLPTVVEHGTVAGNPESAHTKRPDPPAPMRLDVVDLLDTRDQRGVLGVLHSWARIVREDRRLHEPCATCTHQPGTHWTTPKKPHCTAIGCTCPRYLLPQATVAGEAAFLASHLAWITGQDWGCELYAELRPLARQLSDAVGEFRPRPVGRCMALVPVAVGNINDAATIDVLCDGPLMMDQSGYGVACSRCSNRIEANEGLRQLGLKVGLIIDEAV